MFVRWTQRPSKRTAVIFHGSSNERKSLNRSWRRRDRPRPEEIFSRPGKPAPRPKLEVLPCTRAACCKSWVGAARRWEAPATGAQRDGASLGCRSGGYQQAWQRLLNCMTGNNIGLRHCGWTAVLRWRFRDQRVCFPLAAKRKTPGTWRHAGRLVWLADGCCSCLTAAWSTASLAKEKPRSTSVRG